MNVIIISTDQKILEEGSAVRSRILSYGAKIAKLHIILMTKQLHSLKDFQESVQLSDRVVVEIVPYWRVWWWRPPFQPSVVSAQDPFENGFIGWYLAHRYKALLQLQIHTDFLSPYFWKESFKNKIRVLLAQWLLPQAASIRVVSQRIADSLRSVIKSWGGVLTILPVFVDVDKIRSQHINISLREEFPQFSKIILMASRWTQEKNISLAIEAMKIIIATHPHIGLVIVGTGAESNRLQQLVANLHIDANVAFKPWTNDLISYYKTADLFLNTSLYEGYGLTIVEALAAGCPVVSTDVGIAREAGAVLVPNNAEVLARIVLVQIAQPAVVALPPQFVLSRPDYVAAYVNSWNI